VLQQPILTGGHLHTLVGGHRARTLCGNGTLSTLWCVSRRPVASDQPAVDIARNPAST
jgi:hypothetical protein